MRSVYKHFFIKQASFVSAHNQHDDISLDDPNFWEKWAKKADLDIERMKDVS